MMQRELEFYELDLVRIEPYESNFSSFLGQKCPNLIKDLFSVRNNRINVSFGR